MKKKKYSLTAKERKALRNGGKEIKKNDNLIAEGAEGAASAEGEAEAESKPKMKWWTMLIIIVLGAALVVTAAVLPFTCNRYRFVDNPVAKIQLSNGMTLEFEIYENTCNVAATNFIFLAKNKFFNNTIIYDIQQGWVRFGNRKTMTSFVSDDEDYCEKLQGFSDAHKDSKFGYRLRPDDTPDAKRFNEEGMLTFNYKSSSNEFFISSQHNCQTNFKGIYYTPTVIGRYLNDETLQNIKAISEMPMDENSPDDIWKNPVPQIAIKNVAVYNLDKSKWKNFHFENYMNNAGPNGTSVISSWTAN